MKISASLLSCDILNIREEIKILENAGVDSLHIDIMDGRFVPNIAFGIDFINKISSTAQIPVNVHLMIESPETFVDVISRFNIDCIFIHIEDNRNINKTISLIKDRHVKVGIAINPTTSISSVFDLLPVIDEILVMGVHPGFGGQTLIPSTIEKLRSLAVISKKYNHTIGIDGGITEDTAQMAVQAGADVLVVGSYLFDNHVGDNRIFCIKKKIETICQKSKG